MSILGLLRDLEGVDQYLAWSKASFGCSRSPGKGKTLEIYMDLKLGVFF